MELIVHNELARIAIQNGLDKSYVVWCALRCDVNKNNSSSHYNKNDVMSLCADYGLQFSQRSWSRIFAQGEGIFWGTDYNHVFIRSIKRVVATVTVLDKADRRIEELISLSIEIKSSKPQALKAELYLSWFASIDEITIARDTLQELFNLSHTQQRALERILDGRLLKKTNYVHIDKQAHELTAKSPDFEPLPTHAETYTQEYYKSNRVTYRDVVFYQLPNTYCVGRDCGVSPDITARQAQNAVRTQSGRTPCSDTSMRRYYRNCTHFEQYGQGKNGLWRAYYQGSKRVWKDARYA